MFRLDENESKGLVSVFIHFLKKNFKYFVIVTNVYLQLVSFVK